MSTHHAIVVGAGIGGLTAALALARKGLRVTVLEAEREPSGPRVGLPIGPNGTRVLARLGLEPALRRYASCPEALALRTFRRGRPLIVFPLGETAVGHFGAPYLHVLRGDLLGVLMEAASAAPEVEIRLGTRCEGFEPGSERVTANAGGERFDADVLIGADGAGSRIRATLCGVEPARPGRFAVSCGVVEADALKDVALGSGAAIWLGPGAHVVTFTLRGGALVGFRVVREREPDAVEDPARLPDLSGWHPVVAALAGAAPPEARVAWPVEARPPLPSWSGGRVALLGDAGHEASPFFPQSAALALEDAAVLAECLSSEAAAPAALARYEGLRRARVETIRRRPADDAASHHARGIRAWLRNAWLPLTSTRLDERLYDVHAYDAARAAKSG